MDKLYENKDWLYQKYWKEELSISKIADLYNCAYTTIYKWMKKFNIPCRSKSKAVHLAIANHCKLSNKAIEWIEGELLGDGCLSYQSFYSAYFAYSSKYWEYIHYISQTLAFFGIEQTGKIYKYRTNGNNTLFPNIFKYYSKHYDELKLLRNKWYPNGKKIVPKDLKLNPITLRQFFIGDGSLEYHNKNPYIRLATCGFSISDVEWLVEQLNKLGFKTTRQPSYNRIHISTKSTSDFINYIGKCPVKCYQYKWAI